MPRTIERQGSVSAPYTHRYPEVRGGVCEYCGIIDANQPSEYQYKLCPHFRGMGDLWCSYCPDHKNPVETARRSTLNIHVSPTDHNQVIVVCDSFECSDKHNKKFLRNQ